ncbi:MAG: DUF4652 domain-containing protein [Bacillota bacterium]|nr:DUF4652 domain-containing protein [Bacillota bacterium]
MNCRIFMKRLPEFMDGSLLHDMKEAMEKHLDCCEKCRAVYEKEEELDTLFFGSLQLEEITFNSSRPEIIKGIDRNRYGKGPLKKIKYSMRRHRMKIVSSAAVFILCLTAVPFLLGPHSLKDSQYNTSGTGSLGVKENSASAKSEVIADSNANANFNGAVNKGESVLSLIEPPAAFIDLIGNKVYVPKFVRLPIDKLPDIRMSTEPKASPDQNIKVMLYGRGPAGTDDEIAEIVFQNQKDSSIWELSVADNDTKQVSPLYVDWYDNENILVTIGNGRGHVTLGGDLFLVNINTGKALDLYPARSKDRNREVVSAVRNGDMIKLSVKQYDESHTTAQDFDENMYFKEMDSPGNTDGNAKKEMPLSRGIASDYNNPLSVVNSWLVESINKKDSRLLGSILAGDISKDDSILHKELDKIEKLGISRMYSMTDTLGSSNEEILTYCVELEASMKTEGSIFKNDTNFIEFKLEKDDKNNWVITDISRLPQN